MVPSTCFPAAGQGQNSQICFHQLLYEVDLIECFEGSWFDDIKDGDDVLVSEKSRKGLVFDDQL